MNKTQKRSKAGSWNWTTGGLSARIRIRQIYTIDTTRIQRARRTTKRRQNRSTALGRPAKIFLGGFKSEFHSVRPLNVRVAESLALPTSEYGVSPRCYRFALRLTCLSDTLYRPPTALIFQDVCLRVDHIPDGITNIKQLQYCVAI